MSQPQLLKSPSSRLKQTPSSLLLSPQVSNLVQKIDHLNRSCQVDLTKNIFFQMDRKPSKTHRQFEDTLTKLRNLENRSQMNRASVQLMAQRRPKWRSIKDSKDEESYQKDSYLHIYKQIKQQSIIKERLESQINSEEDQLQLNQHGPRGIKHYRYLKEHPKILNFALEKMKDRQSEEKDKVRKEQQQKKMNQGSRPDQQELNEDYKQTFLTSRKTQLDALQSPKAVVDNQMTKFYSKSSKGKLDIKIRQNPRCNHLLLRQSRIMTKAEDKHVSKQNIKKLKQRLNEIVNEMHKSDRRSKDVLPKIQQK